MTNTWLTRRPVRFPVSRFMTSESRLSVWSFALHEEIRLAGAHEFDGLLGGGLAVRHVDDLGIAEYRARNPGRPQRSCSSDRQEWAYQSGGSPASMALLERGLVAQGCATAVATACFPLAAAIRRSYFRRRNVDAVAFSFMAPSSLRQVAERVDASGLADLSSNCANGACAVSSPAAAWAIGFDATFLLQSQIILWELLLLSNIAVISATVFAELAFDTKDIDELASVVAMRWAELKIGIETPCMASMARRSSSISMKN